MIIIAPESPSTKLGQASIFHPEIWKLTMKNRVEIFRGGESRKAYVTFVISKEMKDEGGRKRR